jgi:hypothetical protein
MYYVAFSGHVSLFDDADTAWAFLISLPGFQYRDFDTYQFGKA